MKNKFRPPIFIPLIMAAVVSRESAALGLGRAELDSALGRPLEARISISGAQDLDASQLLVSVQGIWDEDDESALGGLDTRTLTVTSEISETGEGLIYLRSSAPIVEPFINFVLAVRWPTGTIKREYTLLLDLPEQASAIPVGGQLQSAPESVAVSRSPKPQPRPRPLNQRQDFSHSAARYTTVRGDSLWRIAARIRRARGGEQLAIMEQVYHLNPQAFVGGQRAMLKESIELNIAGQALAAAVTGKATSQERAQAHLAPLLPGRAGGASAAASGPAPQGPGAGAGQTPPPGQSEEARLQASLQAVTQEVAAVSANINAMHQRLAELQNQLLVLTREYAALKAVSPEPAPGVPAVSRQADFSPEQAPLQSASLELGSWGEAGTESAAQRADSSVASLATAEPVVAGVALDEGLVAQAETAVQSAASTAEWGGNPASLLLLMVAALLGLLFYRRRKVEQASVDALNYTAVPTTQTKPAVQDFEDIFSELDTRGSQHLASTPAPVAGPAAEEDSPYSAAAACVELGDLRGAQQILESALQESDDRSLQFQLLDVYLRLAEVNAFEALALQMEFAGLDEDGLREIDLLRRELPVDRDAGRVHKG